MNYTLNEYASDVVYRIAQRLQRARHSSSDDHQRIRPRHPAYHSVLIFNALGSSRTRQIR